MTALVEVADARVVYGAGEASIEALKGVSLEVRKGEILMLMGPSGSGKTTLLQVAGALLSPTAGTVRLAGERIDGMTQENLGRRRLRHFGFVFQHYNLFPALTAAENVAIALDLKGVPAARRRAAAHEALDRVGLGDRAAHFPSQLSGGQKQRVAIARALAGEPDAILADEPTAALDSASGKRVVDLLHDLAKAQGRAVVLVTHDPRIVEAADRIVHIEDGRIRDAAEQPLPAEA